MCIQQSILKTKLESCIAPVVRKVGICLVYVRMYVSTCMHVCVCVCARVCVCACACVCVCMYNIIPLIYTSHSQVFYDIYNLYTTSVSC